jgi:hypothetical protein
VREAFARRVGRVRLRLPAGGCRLVVPGFGFGPTGFGSALCVGGFRTVGMENTSSDISGPATFGDGVALAGVAVAVLGVAALLVGTVVFVVVPGFRSSRDRRSDKVAQREANYVFFAAVAKSDSDRKHDVGPVDVFPDGAVSVSSGLVAKSVKDGVIKVASKSDSGKCFRFTMLPSSNVPILTFGESGVCSTNGPVDGRWSMNY